jgi:hypothetical protein
MYTASVSSWTAAAVVCARLGSVLTLPAVLPGGGGYPTLDSSWAAGLCLSACVYRCLAACW